MSEIKKRRKVTHPYGNENLRATYEIDAALFAKDGGIIHLPNPKGKSITRDPDWSDITLVENFQPWVTSSLYKTIQNLGYFAFVYIESFSRDGKVINWHNVVITDKQSYCLIRDEVDADGTGEIGRSLVDDALLWFQEDGTYDGRDFYQNEIGDNLGYEYSLKPDTGWIDEGASDLRGFKIVELSLRQHKDE